VILTGVAAVLAGIGVVQAAAGAVLVGQFAATNPSPAERERLAGDGTGRPPITVLKPLHGDEPLLEQALSTVCAQDYPEFQVVFGVRTLADPALRVVRRLRARFPACDIAIEVEPAQHGPNGKVSNLINMLPRAKHAVLVIADSDLHVQPDYLARLADALAKPDTGLVTTLYTGLPAAHRLAQQLGATQITHSFLPGALLARAMGRQDCLGATMVLHRATLARIGGFQALVGHLADDQVLGRRVAALGLRVRLAATVPATTVPEGRLRDLLRHELRWARTIRALEPGAFAASVLQYPLFWALLTVLLAGGAPWSFGVFFIAWVGRALAAVTVDRELEPMLGVAIDSYPGRRPPLSPALVGDGPRGDGARGDGPRGDNPRGDNPRGGNPRGDGPRGAGPATRAPGDFRLEDAADLADATAEGLAFACPVWLLPLRDLISVGVMLASYAGRRVDWRGHPMTADTPGRVAPGLPATD
jgi:ceramide glucosyltransferase